MVSGLPRTFSSSSSPVIPPLSACLLRLFGLFGLMRLPPFKCTHCQKHSGPSLTSLLLPLSGADAADWCDCLSLSFWARHYMIPEVRLSHLSPCPFFSSTIIINSHRKVCPLFMAVLSPVHVGWPRTCIEQDESFLLCTSLILYPWIKSVKLTETLPITRILDDNVCKSLELIQIQCQFSNVSAGTSLH